MLPSRIVALALSISYSVAAVPPQGRAPLHIPVVRRHNIRRGGKVDPDRLSAAVERLKNKYQYQHGHGSPSRRAQTADINITNEDQDTAYFAPVNVGTPAQEMLISLDTGSSDLWFTTTGCLNCSSDTPLFDPTASSTFQGGTQDIPLSYGSGSADGTIGNDTVSMGPFTVNPQVFVLVDQLTSGLIEGRISGIMGLSFQDIASTGALPFWQALINDGQLTSAEFSFYMTRFVNDPSASGQEEPGGVFTLGGRNSTFFEGDPDFQPFPSAVTGSSAWFQTVSSVMVNGQDVNIGTDQAALIDTGTTLIGVPSTAANAIWSSIPGAQPLSGQSLGFWAFPCSSDLNISISFGGPSWPISGADLNLGPNTDGLCVGAIFDSEVGLNISGSTPLWIVGDTFLKNVYTVFRADPPAVGFAQLSAAAGGQSVQDGRGSSLTGTAQPQSGGGGSWAVPLGIPNMLVTSALSLLTAIFMLAA